MCVILCNIRIGNSAEPNGGYMRRRKMSAKKKTKKKKKGVKKGGVRGMKKTTHHIIYKGVEYTRRPDGHYQNDSGNILSVGVVAAILLNGGDSEPHIKSPEGFTPGGGSTGGGGASGSFDDGPSSGGDSGSGDSAGSGGNDGGSGD